jgi:hypothetical protein
MIIRHCGVLALPILAGIALGGWLGEASAQQPTQEQIAAIRQSCRSDFMAQCAGVQPGGREALQCLKRNAESVSAPCKAALDAVGPKPAPAAAEQEPAAPPAANAPEQPAAAAPQSAPAEPAQAGPTPPAESPPGPAPTEAGRPGPRPVTAVPPACRAEFVEHCPGVRPGSPVALRCLQVNAAALSPACQSALAGGGEGSPPPAAEAEAPPPAAAAPPAAAPPPAAAAPLGPIPPLMPRQAMQIMSFCGQERWTLCGNVPPGGGRIIACLAENAPRLSPPCYRAIARAIR